VVAPSLLKGTHRHLKGWFIEAPAKEMDDQRFDAGEDLSAEVDWTKSRRLNVEARQANVDFPSRVVTRLDRQTQKLGITRQVRRIAALGLDARQKGR
jgi:hypothetical protein